MFVAFVAAACLRRYAHPHLARLAADRFADARVYRSVTVIAGARPRRRARTKNTRLLALRPADEWLILILTYIYTHLVAVQAHRADVRGCATAVGARTIADRLAHKRRGFVADSRVTGMARAHIRLGAVAVIPLAFRVADGPAGESVRVQPVVLVATANLRLDTGAVDAAVCAFRYARAVT